MSQYFVLASALFFSCFAAAHSMQRIEILGSTQDGEKILLLRTHFGPSSQSPFANIEIINDQQDVFLRDGLFIHGGGEESFAVMKKELLEKHKTSISEQGIVFQSFQPAPAFSSIGNGQMLIEADLMNGGLLSRFHMYLESQDPSHPLDREICYLSSPVICQKITLEDYSTGEIQFSRVTRVGDYLWLFLFNTLDPLGGPLFFQQKVISFPLKP